MAKLRRTHVMIAQEMVARDVSVRQVAAQLPILPLQRLQSLLVLRRQARSLACSRFARRTHCLRVSLAHPILLAMEVIASHCVS